MKKMYQKPEIIFEDFLMSTNIAAGCEVRPGSEELNIPSLGVLFTNSGESCTYIPDMNGGDGGAGGICYQVHVDERNIFNS